MRAVTQLRLAATDTFHMVHVASDSGAFAPDFSFELGTAGYPERLRELGTPPASVHGLGRLPDLRGAVAIVGTRACSAEAEIFTRQLAESLARAGLTIVSGGAHGIDTAAHRGALDASGATVAVLPSYLDAPYPRRNAKLFEAIRGRGALVTEATKPCAPSPSRCISRNRLIAALADFVVVVQAPARSGANATAKAAKDLGRPLLVVPASPWDPRGEGNLSLLDAGARICTGADDVLSLAAVEPPVAPSRDPGERKKPNDFPGLDDDQGAVCQVLSLGPRGVEELCDSLALSADRVQRSVLTLLLCGEIEEVSSGRYRKVRR